MHIASVNHRRTPKDGNLGRSCAALGAICALAGAALFGTFSFARSDTGTTTALNLPDFGEAGTGSDDTRIFQTALAAAASSQRPLHVPQSPSPYQVQPLFLPTNTDLILDAGVVIQATPGYSPAQKLINIDDVSNVKIVGRGAVLRMRRDEYTTGEYRHCIELQGATDVRLLGMTCNDSGGDGVYIGSGAQGFSKNIVVEDCTFFNSRRQGLTITSSSGVWIRHCNFLRSNGAAPEDGIDLEPNTAEDRLENIHIEDCLTEGNHGDGLSFGLAALTAKSTPVDITVLRLRSNYNQRAGITASYEVNGTLPGVPGKILIDRATNVGNGTYGAVASFFSGSGPVITFQDLAIYDANQTGTTYDNAAIAVQRGGGGIGPEGNVYFVNPIIVDTTGKLDYYFTLRDYSDVGFAHVQISGSVSFSGAAHARPYGLVQGKGTDAVSIP